MPLFSAGPELQNALELQMQAIELLMLSEWVAGLLPVFHRSIHSASKYQRNRGRAENEHNDRLDRGSFNCRLSPGRQEEGPFACAVESFRQLGF
jgi:hypothetical protein